MLFIEYFRCYHDLAVDQVRVHQEVTVGLLPKTGRLNLNTYMTSWEWKHRISHHSMMDSGYWLIFPSRWTGSNYCFFKIITDIFPPCYCVCTQEHMLLLYRGGYTYWWYVIISFWLQPKLLHGNSESVFPSALYSIYIILRLGKFQVILHTIQSLCIIRKIGNESWLRLKLTHSQTNVTLSAFFFVSHTENQLHTFPAVDELWQLVLSHDFRIRGRALQHLLFRDEILPLLSVDSKWNI